MNNFSSFFIKSENISLILVCKGNYGDKNRSEILVFFNQ